MGYYIRVPYFRKPPNRVSGLTRAAGVQLRVRAQGFGFRVQGVRLGPADIVTVGAPH